MASLMGARRRAEQFAAAVEARTPTDEVPADLRELVSVVGAVRELEPPAPRPEFALSLREQLMAEAQTALTPASPLALPARRRARERRLTAAAAVFTLVGGTAGMAAAAQDALPGDALYPIKRGIEDARLSVQSDADSRGRSYLEQASSRLEEADRLVQDDASSLAVADTVDSFVVQAVAGADLLLAAYADEGAPEDVDDLRAFAAGALTQVRELAESAPADIQDELARAAVVLQRIDQQAAATCEECSDRPSLEMPVLMAQAAEISRAMEAVRTENPNNDHPPLDPPAPQPDRAAQQPREQGGQGGSGGGQSSQPDQGGAVDTEGAPRVLTKDPQQLLKGVDDATGGLVGELSSSTKDTTDSTTETVEDIGDELEDGLDDTIGGE